MRLKPKAKESSEPVFIEDNNKTSKGREGWELQNFQMVELLQLSSTAQNETQGHRSFTRPFIVHLLSEGKPMMNTVLPNRTYT